MTRIGSYEVLFELARGGMGTVELARGRSAGGVERLVAIKRIHAHLLSSSEVVERFLAEARVISQVHHANVVGLHQVTEGEGGYHLVLDYVEGDSLDGLIDLAGVRRERVPTPVVLRIILDALHGLHAAHDAKDSKGNPLGILHRDVSTQNLLVGRDGVTRLSDFGISKSVLHSVVTDARYIAGKIVYMPPEYLRRQQVDRRMDIYALGVTLWIALVGHEPWPGTAEAQAFSLALTEGIPSLSSEGVSISPELEWIVTRACSPVAAARFATARQMIDAIEDLGRKHTPIASQAEVGEYVEARIGGVLDARRVRIAQRMQQLADTNEAESSPKAAPPSATSEQPITAVHLLPGSDHAADDGRHPWKRGPLVPLALAGLVSLALIAALAVRFSSAPSEPKAVGEIRGERSAPVVAETAAAAPVAPPRPDESAPAVSASASTQPIAPASAASAVSAHPPRTAPTRRSEGQAPAVPTQISTANPYR